MSEQITGDIDVAARNHRERIAISIEEQRRWRDPNAALSHWIQAIEALGCLVFQASGIEVREMRGISFHHPYAPAILLNTADAPRGRIFTLLHEYSHLILGAGGLCDYSEPINARSATAKTEVFCNKFAASVLLPADDLGEHAIVRAHVRRRRWNDEELSKLSVDYSVSSEAILRRLVGLELASLEDYEDRRGGFIGATPKYHQKGKANSGGLPWHKRVVKANGKRFTRLVLSSYDEEFITGSDLAEYLGTDLKHLPAIEREVS
ncbi:MAG: ImmA/IrrE family metallo-endopeptidase [Planctomycetes bacterium]|nr:ImmA/IrrE family metallo-endopeptidase [Planctomycetota bacterium]